MTFRHRLRPFARSEQGAVAVITAIVMTVLIGFAAIAVDVASFHYDSRRLQGAADLAAIAAASNPANATQAARATFTDNGRWTLSALTVETGNYDPDPTKAQALRFVANRQPVNAARVIARAPSPVYFGRIHRHETLILSDQSPDTLAGDGLKRPPRSILTDNRHA